MKIKILSIDFTKRKLHKNRDNNINKYTEIFKNHYFS